MALVLEDGSGIAAANALVSIAEADAHFADYGNSSWAGAEGLKSAAILRASLWVSSFPSWDGEQTYGRGEQGLSHPRSGMTDCNEDDIADDAIANEVKLATFIVAVAELVTPNIMTPSVTAGRVIKKERVEGAVDIEYADLGKQGLVKAMRPVLTQVEDLLRCMATFGHANVPWPMVK